MTCLHYRRVVGEYRVGKQTIPGVMGLSALLQLKEELRMDSNLDDKRVFEVLRVEQNDNHWELGGLPFDTIKRNDILFTSEQSNNGDGALRIIDIVTYGHHIEEIVRGLTGTLVIQSIGAVDLTQVKYLYRPEARG
jgi:hypothetical protein